MIFLCLLGDPTSLVKLRVALVKGLVKLRDQLYLPTGSPVHFGLGKNQSFLSHDEKTVNFRGAAHHKLRQILNINT